jgi:hypothetical protein
VFIIFWLLLLFQLQYHSFFFDRRKVLNPLTSKSNKFDYELPTNQPRPFSESNNNKSTMGGAPTAKEYPLQYFGASALAASGCYPLWRSAAIGQSGFQVSGLRVLGAQVPEAIAPYVYGFLPPYKGAIATVVGMTYARAAIFYFSDIGREYLLAKGTSEATATIAPPLVMGFLVQVINQPIVRATVTLQDPAYKLPNVWASLKHIYAENGVAGLWHGTTAGVLKVRP